MKAIYINPKNQTFATIEGPMELEDLQKLVHGLIENVSVKGGVTIYANEEAAFKAEALDPDFMHAFEIPGYTNGMIIGPAVVLGDDGQGGEVSVNEGEILALITETAWYECS